MTDPIRIWESTGNLGAIDAGFAHCVERAYWTVWHPVQSGPLAGPQRDFLHRVLLEELSGDPGYSHWRWAVGTLRHRHAEPTLCFRVE